MKGVQTAEQEEVLREKQVKNYNEELRIDSRWKVCTLSYPYVCKNQILTIMDSRDMCSNTHAQSKILIV